jgi:hypothetical protein
MRMALHSLATQLEEAASNPDPEWDVLGHLYIILSSIDKTSTPKGHTINLRQ